VARLYAYAPRQKPKPGRKPKDGPRLFVYLPVCHCPFTPQRIERNGIEGGLGLGAIGFNIFQPLSIYIYVFNFCGTRATFKCLKKARGFIENVGYETSLKKSLSLYNYIKYVRSTNNGWQVLILMCPVLFIDQCVI